MKKLTEEAMAKVVGGKMFDWQKSETPCIAGESHVDCTLTVFWIPIHWSGDFPC